MAEAADSSVVLMSIKPHWADAIMAGRKRVEFRRARFARHVSHVIVYATAPVKRVVGFFAVDQIVEAAPGVLWRMFGSEGEIDSGAFDEYYLGVRGGVAIGVGEVTRLPMPLELDAVLPSAVPPQSYRYADSGVIPLLEAWAKSADHQART